MVTQSSSKLALCFNRLFLAAFVAIFAILVPDETLVSTAFTASSYTTSSEFSIYMKNKSSRVCRRLMFRRHLMQHQLNRLCVMSGNDRKRMSSRLNCSREKIRRNASSSDSKQQQYRPLVIVLAGPTAVGKSDVAAELCSHSIATEIMFRHKQASSNQNESTRIETRGHVVSADSVQVYRGVDIGANKPSQKERERTPHHLVDIVDPPNHDSASKDQNSNKVSSYNAADWMRDAEYIIRKLTLYDDEDGDMTSATLDEELVTRRECINSFLNKSLEEENKMTPIPPVLPVVVGGTMMYLTWLVHGRPDAVRPTDEAVKRAADVISKFQLNLDDGKIIGSNSNEIDGFTDANGPAATETPERDDAAEERAWAHASTYVSSLGPVFAERVAKLCGRDWYRLRRLLEVAYTIAQSKMQSKPTGDGSDTNDESFILRNLTDAEVYTGIRSGSLSDAGFDVRCFFLCPNERMLHFHTVDQRCEDMLLRGLLKETANLFMSGGLPDDSQLTRAIGYRQALEYLLRKDAKMNDNDAFLSFVDDFATATRQYAKKQMQWFRKDPDFAFIPVDMECNKVDRVKDAAKLIADMCQLSREDFESQLKFNIDDSDGNNEDTPISVQTKLINEKQGKQMKFFMSKREKLVLDSILLGNAIRDADECTVLLKGH